MPAKKRTGGRVTPKGTQPAGSAHKRDDHAPGSQPSPPRSAPGRPDQAHGRGASGPVAPTRSGHHRGNR
jgi:hypothetical protein